MIASLTLGRKTRSRSRYRRPLLPAISNGRVLCEYDRYEPGLCPAPEKIAEVCIPRRRLAVNLSLLITTRKAIIGSQNQVRRHPT